MKTISNMMELRRWVDDAIGELATPELVECVAGKMGARSWWMNVGWGDDWSRVLDMSEDQWNAMLSEAMAEVGCA